MLTIIKYKAKLSWADSARFYKDVMCDVTHIINTMTLETTSLTFKPVEETE